MPEDRQKELIPCDRTMAHISGNAATEHAAKLSRRDIVAIKRMFIKIVSREFADS